MGSQDDLPISPKRLKKMIIFSVVTMILTFVCSSMFFGVFFDTYHVVFFLVVAAKLTSSVHTFFLCSKKDFLTRKNIHYSGQIMGSVAVALYLYPGFYCLMKASSYTKEQKDEWVTGFYTLTLTDAGLFIAANVFSYIAIARFKSGPDSVVDLSYSPPPKREYTENKPSPPTTPIVIYQQNPNPVVAHTITHATVPVITPVMGHNINPVLAPGISPVQQVVYQPPVQAAHGVQVTYAQPQYPPTHYQVPPY